MAIAKRCSDLGFHEIVVVSQAQSLEYSGSFGGVLLAGNAFVHAYVANRIVVCACCGTV